MPKPIAHRLAVYALIGLPLLYSCQDSVAPVESKSTATKLVFDPLLADSAYMPDQIVTRVGAMTATNSWNKLTPVTFHLEVNLSQPLGALDTLQIGLVKWGMQSITIRCTEPCGDDSTWKVHHDHTAEHLLRLMDSTPTQPRNRTGLLALYAKALISGDSTLTSFPAKIPVGVSRDSLQDQILLQAQKNASSLAAIVDSVKWMPTRNIDSLRTLYLDLINRKSLTTSDSIRLFPGAPKLLRLPDQAVRNVQKDSAQYDTRWVVSGGSAPFTVLIEGVAATADGSIYDRVVPVAYGSNSVHISVADRTGAKAFDTITVIRDDGPPALVRTQPADTSAVLFDSTSLAFSWNASDVSGVKSLTIDGKTAVRTESVWSIRLDLVQGSNQFIAIAEDSLGNKAPDTVKIRRLLDIQGPRIAAIEGLGARGVPYDSATAPIALNISDIGGVKSVRIAGTLVTGFANRYQTNVPLTVGVNAIAIETEDSAGNPSRDTVRLERHRPMAIALAATQSASAVVFQNDSVAVWGGIDLGTILNPPALGPMVSIAASSSNFVALTSAGTVSSWGSNYYGESTPPANLSGVVAVAAGATHALALKRDGSVVAWGDTAKGCGKMPYGLADVAAIAGGYHFTAGLKKDGTVWVWGDSSLHQTSVPEGLANATAISAGFGHVVVLLKDGTVKAWGDNASGQTSVPANLAKAVQIAAGGGHTLALLADSTVVGWGDNANGQTSVPEGLHGVVAITAGDAHSLALLRDGSVVAWGENKYGQAKVPATVAKY